MLGDDVDAGLGRQQLTLAAREARTRMRVGEDAAEVRIAALRLAEQRHVRTVCQADLGTGDRAHTEVLRRVCELE